MHVVNASKHKVSLFQPDRDAVLDDALHENSSSFGILKVILTLLAIYPALHFFLSAIILI